jgi:hypothetical protein
MSEAMPSSVSSNEKWGEGLPREILRKKFKLSWATKVGEAIVEGMRPYCQRIQIAGSVRRKKQLVGDIEIIYVPKIIIGIDTTDLFHRSEKMDVAELKIEEWVRTEKLSKRLNVQGNPTWGGHIKLAVAVKSKVRWISS